ncbi:MAG: hypothetical protein E7323_08380 [Clostridiales bacterium]|nr:hypothetical protein [Clostridiales bacterium]
MAKEFYGYFDSKEGDVRQYDAAELAHLLAGALQNGVASHNGGGLLVSADGTSMKTTVSCGGAVINGYLFVLSDDGGAAKTFTHQVSGSADRIDRIIVRLNLNDRKISLRVLEGVPGAMPVPPSLTRNSQTWDLSLAQVRIRASAAFVTASDVIDERSNEGVCGYAVPVWNNTVKLAQRFVTNQPITNAQINSAIV